MPHPGLPHPVLFRVRRGALAAVLTAGLVGVLALAPGTAIARTVTQDFESDPIGSVPAGCTTPEAQDPAAVSDERARSGDRAVLLEDSTGSQAGMDCPITGAAGADLRFWIHPDTLQDGAQISFLGAFEGKPESDVPVFQLRINPDGSIAWFDGLEQDNLGWTTISAPGAVPSGSWTPVTVQVPTDHREARVYTDAHPHRSDYVGAAGPVGVSPVAEITGYRFGTAPEPEEPTVQATEGQQQTGDRVFVDDVSIGSGDGARPAPRGAAAPIADPTIVDSTSEGFMQMPNTAVTLPQRWGPDEILVGYPVHGDATHDTGTNLASSTDGGRTWSGATERNPFPEEQSFYLSRLDNGDLLAVSYHTFMVEDGQNTQATVPTAVSSDGGRSWTHREGTMTAPEEMRPISDGTSRPGHPLGGFVLVHRVVEDSDGTLYQSGYGYYADDDRYRQIVLASTDGGVNWNVRSTVAVDPELSDHPRYEGFCEGTIVRAANGSLLTVMRTGNYQQMYQSRSYDDGATWSEPEPILAGEDSIPVVGVFPDLLRLDNGALALYIGRPGQSMLVSPDGSGRSWSSPTMIDYLNSGNGTQVPLGRNKVLAFGDRGADWTPNVPEEKAVWATPVRINRWHHGR